MAMVDKLQHYLDSHAARYTHSIHMPAFTAREVARAEELPPHEIAKSIVFFGDAGFGLAVVPANRLVDLSELRIALGWKHLRLATEQEIGRLFPDTELGAMPPFGNLYGLPVYADRELADEEVIAFNAGTHRDVVHMKYADFMQLVKPTVLSFAKVM